MRRPMGLIEAFGLANMHPRGCFRPLDRLHLEKHRKESIHHLKELDEHVPEEEGTQHKQAHIHNSFPYASGRKTRNGGEL